MTDTDPDQYPPSDAELSEQAWQAIDADSQNHEEAKADEQQAEDEMTPAPDG